MEALDSSGLPASIGVAADNGVITDTAERHFAVLRQQGDRKDPSHAFLEALVNKKQLDRFYQTLWSRAFRGREIEDAIRERYSGCVAYGMSMVLMCLFALSSALCLFSHSPQDAPQATAAALPPSILFETSDYGLQTIACISFSSGIDVVSCVFVPCAPGAESDPLVKQLGNRLLRGNELKSACWVPCPHGTSSPMMKAKFPESIRFARIPAGLLVWCLPR